MDALPLIIDVLEEPVLEFIQNNVPGDVTNYYSIRRKVYQLHEFRKSSAFRFLPGDEKQALFESVRLTVHKLENFLREIVGRKAGSSEQSSSSGNHDLMKDWNEIQHLIIRSLEATNYSKHIEGQLEPLQWININDIERIEDMLLETADRSNCITLNEEQSHQLLLKKAFPAAFDENQFMLKYESCIELGNLPHLICKACEGQPLALLLIGSLLSLKPMAYDTWNRVKDDLNKIKGSNNHVTSDHMGHIFTYCYNDLPYSLQLCFLYFACYPIGYEIPVTSLTQIWMAERFVIPKKQETIAEAANRFLEELVQRYSPFFGKLTFGLIIYR